MIDIDIEAPINAVLLATSGAVVLVMTYYVQRFLRRRAAADAIEEALKQGAAIAARETRDPVVQVQVATAYVERAAPQALKTLNVEPPALKAKVEQKIASSRSMYFGD